MVLFPSAAVAWKLGNEPFIQNLGVFEQLKLRASYGITGNSGGPYKSIALLENTNYVYGGQLVIGYYPGRDHQPGFAVGDGLGTGYRVRYVFLKGQNLGYGGLLP